MDGFIKDFALSLSMEFVPDREQKEEKNEPKNFALIPEMAHSVSKSDIELIIKNTGLSPILILPYTDGYVEARRFARLFGSAVLKPRNFKEWEYALYDCAFSVAEGIVGSVISVLSHTPVYLYAGNEECRRFICKLGECGYGENIIFPYTKGRISEIKKVEVRDFDFFAVIDFLRSEIGRNFKEIFMP